LRHATGHQVQVGVVVRGVGEFPDAPHQFDAQPSMPFIA